MFPVVHAPDHPIIQLITGRGDIGQEMQGRFQGATHLGAAWVTATAGGQSLSAG